jgi:methylmalonyl-CoA mutase N-terminal domain/subunit
LKKKPGQNDIKKSYLRWKKENFDKTLKSGGERNRDFTTVSGKEIKELYTPADLEEFDYKRDLGFPGEYPYTRGHQQKI